MNRIEAEKLVHRALDTVNGQLPATQRLPKTADTVIIGPAGRLDSLGIINFVVTLEELVSETVGAPVQLLNEADLANGDGPFQTVGTLTRFLEAMRT